MSWVQYHAQSEQYASLAEAAVRDRDLERAAELYRLAAEREDLALAHLDKSKPRTLGITAVSTAALWLKAHDFQRARAVAASWLAADALPQFATKQLQELLNEIPREESARQNPPPAATNPWSIFPELVIFRSMAVDMPPQALAERWHKLEMVVRVAWILCIMTLGGAIALGATWLGALSLFASAVTAAISALFIRQEQATFRQMKEVFTQTMEGERMKHLLVLCEALETAEERDQYRKKIIDHILQQRSSPRMPRNQD